jgi:hypothetical protein
VVTLDIRIAISTSIARRWTSDDTNLVTGLAVGQSATCSSKSRNNL